MSAIYLTAANLVLCACWGFGAFARLRASHAGVVMRIRLIYAGMLVAACASGFQFQLFGEYAGYADLTVSTTMVGFIALGAKRWKHGAPRDLIKRTHALL